MSSGIQVSHMTRAYAGFLKSSQRRADGQTREAGDFRSVAERIAQSAGDKRPSVPEDTGAAGMVQDMTTEEYRRFVYDRIALLPLAPSQAGWNWYVDISDVGLEAMKNDPAYEKYVLDTIRQHFSAPDPFGSRSFGILHFGASQEESYGQSWVYDSPADQGKDEEGYWEQRMERRKKLQKLLEELMEKRALARRQGLPEPGSLDISELLALLGGGI